MSFVWKASENTFQENARWSLLRAIEWGIWPAFLSIPLVPLLLLFVPLWHIIIIVGILTILWSFVKYKFVNVLLATLGCFWVQLKWVSIPVSIVLLSLRRHYVLACVALVWPFISSFFGLVSGGTQIGRIEEMFMKKLGCIPDTDKIADILGKAVHSQKTPITGGRTNQSCNIDDLITAGECCNDEAIKVFANQFKEVVINKNKERVASMIRYPLKATFKDKAVIINNEKDFLVLYDDIFNNSLCNKIGHADIQKMFADNNRVMMCGAGDVWLGKDGNDVKVTAVGVCRSYHPEHMV